MRKAIKMVRDGKSTISPSMPKVHLAEEQTVVQFV